MSEHQTIQARTHDLTDLTMDQVRELKESWEKMINGFINQAKIRVVHQPHVHFKPRRINRW